MLNQRNNCSVKSSTKEGLSLTKICLDSSYFHGDILSFIICIKNFSQSTFSDTALKINSGQYSFGKRELFPLSFVENSARLLTDGISLPIKVEIKNNHLLFTKFIIPSKSTLLISYKAETNHFAPLFAGSQIESKASLTCECLSKPLEVSALLKVFTADLLSTKKEVLFDGFNFTCTLTITNAGISPTKKAIIVKDRLPPFLSKIKVGCNGRKINFTYDQKSGKFSLLENQLTVPAATISRNILTGSCEATPGALTIVIDGTIQKNFDNNKEEPCFAL